jgi:TP901 family phage tail tape measure protein
MSKVYKEIQEEDKKFGTNRAVALIEELAGKNRSNIISAILSNPDILEQVKTTSENSAGSALREQEIQLESIEGRMATFKAQAEEFWTSFVDTKVVKNAISFGTDVLDIVTKLTRAVPSLRTAFSGLVALMATKGGFGLLNYNRNAKGDFFDRFSSPILSMFQRPTLSTGTEKALTQLEKMEDS